MIAPFKREQNGPFRPHSSSLTALPVPPAPNSFTRAAQPLPFALLSVAARAPKSLPYADQETSMRPSRRQPDELRAISLERGVVKYAEGSCFVKFGDTHVLVTATLEDRLPPWLKGQARGWVTAEYGMLPRATSERTRL